jgi:hypothetical protein
MPVTRSFCHDVRGYRTTNGGRPNAGFRPRSPDATDLPLDVPGKTRQLLNEQEQSKAWANARRRSALVGGHRPDMLQATS